MPINPEHPIFKKIERQYERERDPDRVAMDPELYESLEQIGRNCHAIIKGIEAEGLTHLRFSDIMRFTGSTELSRQDVAAVTFMAGCDGHILDPRFEFWIDGEPIPLTDEQRDHVVSEKGPMPHPVTGEMIENPQAHTYVSYDVVEGVFDWQPENEDTPNAA
jgi:hypothetical protein